MPSRKLLAIYQDAKYAMTTSILEVLQEVVEEDQATPSMEVAMTKPPAKLSRVQRLSSFLPNLKINSKAIEDHDASILRKPAPASHQQNTQYATNGHPSRRPPSPPAAPRSVSANLPRQSNRLRRPDSPSTHQGVPRASSSGNPQIPTAQQSSRPRSPSLLPPVTNTNEGQMRAVSSAMAPRPASPYTDDEASGGKVSKRKSWLPGGGRRSRNASQDLTGVAGSKAWVITGNGQLDYGLNPLVNGDKVRPFFPDRKTCCTYFNLGRRTMGSQRESRCIRIFVSTCNWPWTIFQSSLPCALILREASCSTR
jgi:hypothetical protein